MGSTKLPREHLQLSNVNVIRGFLFLSEKLVFKTI
jgi:hypothetical protein